MSDLISRKAAIDAVAKWLYDVLGINESDGTATIFKRLRELPPAEPQERKGKWIIVRNGSNQGICDKCGYLGYAWMNFCPICGQDNRMEVDNEQND